VAPRLVRGVGSRGLDPVPNHCRCTVTQPGNLRFMPKYDRDDALPIGSMGGTPLAQVTDHHRIFEIPIDDIEIPESGRALDETAIEQIVDSIKTVGFQAQGVIAVMWSAPGEPHRAILVAGRHRLEAFRRLGWTKVPAAIFTGDDDTARLWQLAENLARCDLTALQRAEHLAEFVALKGVQIGQVSGGRGHTGGISAAARDLGTSRAEIYRAREIAGLAPEAKTAAVHLGLADNAFVLGSAASKPGAQAQIAELRREAAKRARWREARVRPPRLSMSEADENVLSEVNRCAIQAAKLLLEGLGTQRAVEIVDLIHRSGPLPGMAIGEALERLIDHLDGGSPTVSE